MIAIKFDEEKVKHCIQAYKDEHGKHPYLIMSEKTREILPPPTPTAYCGGLAFGDIKIDNKAIDLVIDGTKYISEEEAKKGSGNWNGCKIMIDNDLEFGEVHIG